MRVFASWPFLFCSLLLPLQPVHARSLLDYIRSYDLNDYSFGAAVAGSQSPYAGSSNSVYAYPYLTSFRHSTLTDDWFLTRGENIGIRYLTDGGWELGVVGRIQTLGFGNAESETLAGLSDRRWAAESGPLIGWRRWPVQVQWRTYWEIPNRHDGMTSELELALPREFARGYFVPGIKLTYLSAAYSNYYFGISPAEATPVHPAYAPGSAVNTWVGLTLGYAVAARWLLTTTVGLEAFDSAISDSPIVARDRRWRASVGLAYNADLFRPRDFPIGDGQQSLTLRIGALHTAVSSKIRRDAENGMPGTDIDIEDFLGIADRETVTEYGAMYRATHYHRFELSYFELLRRSDATLERDIQFGDESFPAGTEVQTGIDTRLWRLVYGFSLMRDGQKELGVSAGLSYAKVETRLTAADAQESERARLETPLPTIGVFGSVALSEDWRLGADIQAFGLKFDRYQGILTYLNLGLDRRFGDHLAAGLGYSYYGIRLEAKDSALHGRFTMRHHGPKLYLNVGF